MNIIKNKLSIFAAIILLFLATPVFAHAFVADIFYTMVQVFLGSFFVLAGYLLNYSIQFSVIDFALGWQTNGIGYAVDSIWVNIRDLFNMTFIFALVYIGFKMILNSDDSNTRRMLVHLIMAALLINFSLYITKFIIDFTNMLATQIVVGGFSASSINNGAIDISGTFMNSFGLSSLFGELPEAGEPWALIFGTALIFLVGMFVFAAGAILLLIRYVSLLLYMIFSPLMFIGWVFPQLQSVSDKYWKGFLGKAFFAPVYILLLYVSASIIYRIYGNGGVNFGKTLTTTDKGQLDATFAATFPPFIISSIFLVASIVIASKLGADGAGAAMRAGKAFRGKVQKGVTRLPRSGARIGLNKAGEVTRRRLNTLQTGKGWMARAARTNLIAQTVGGTAEKASKAQLGTGTTNKTERDYKAKTNSRVAASQKYEKAKTDSKTAETTVDLTKAMDDLRVSLLSMSKEEKNGLPIEELKDESVARHLTDNDMKNLEESGNFSHQQIGDIRMARDKSFTSIASSGNTAGGPTTGPTGNAIDARENLFKGKSAADIANIPSEVFVNENMTKHLSPQIINSAINGGKLTNTDIDKLQSQLQTHVGNLEPGSVEHNKWSGWSQKDSVGMMFGLNTNTPASTQQKPATIKDKLKAVKASNGR